MPITIQCPNPTCRASANVAETFAGRGVKCKKCGTPFKAVATLDGEPADTKGNGPTSERGDPFPSLPAEFGRYRVLKLLGRGGMGAVYLAEDSQLGRQVALKLPSFDASETKRVERFVREARAAAGLMHPNICPVYDAGQIRGRPFITMAYLAGDPLESAIRPDAPMDQRRAAEIVRKIALALQDAHEKGIVHRDLKPANVMLTAKGEPVVMDFGLAKRISEADANEVKLTQHGVMMGTPSYMAPEQVKGELESIGPATDVYSLGVILFQLVTGRVPYRGTLAMVLSQILLADVPAIEEFRTDVDPQLAAICRQAMAKDPAARFLSMAAFAGALSEYLTPPPASGSPVEVPVEKTRIPSNSVPVEPVNAFAAIDDTGRNPTRRPSSRQSISGAKPSKRAGTNRAVGIGAAVSGVLVLILLADIFLRTPKGGTTADSSVAQKPRMEPPSPPETRATPAGPPDPVVPTQTVSATRSNPRSSTDVAPSVGFVPLFNGKDLSGWIVESGDAANWKVDNGTIAIDAGETIREENWLLTEKSYKDFIAKFEFKAEGGTTNSGFAYRCVPGERPVVGANNTPYSVPTHLQIELFSAQTLRDRTRVLVTGTLLGSLNPQLALKGDPFGQQKPDGEWNEMVVEARGQTLKVRLNGGTILDGNLDDLINQGGRYPGLKRTEGRIGFQRLRGPARFRNIQIKEFPSGIAAVPKPPPTLVVLRELPNGPDKIGPWVSPDGLTLYWAEKPNGLFSLWRANRKSIDARFEGATRIGSGYDLTLSKDLCELIYADKGSGGTHHLYRRTKSKPDDPQFSAPQLIQEFESLGYLCAPCLSDDGLTLYAERIDRAAKQPNVFFRRTAKGRPWGPPEDLALSGLPGKGNLRFPFVTADGKYLFGTSDASPSGMVVLSSADGGNSFGNPKVIELPPGGPTKGIFPRYVAATGELFFSSNEAGGGKTIGVLRNFDPANCTRTIN